MTVRPTLQLIIHSASAVRSLFKIGIGLKRTKKQKLETD